MNDKIYVETDASKYVKSITVAVKITGMNMVRFRLWLSIQIIRFAVWVGGFSNAAFEVVDKT